MVFEWCKDHKNPLSIIPVTKCATIHVGFVQPCVAGLRFSIEKLIGADFFTQDFYLISFIPPTYQYLSDFYDSKCIKKLIKRAIKYILNHKNPIGIGKDGEVKSICKQI